MTVHEQKRQDYSPGGILWYFYTYVGSGHFLGFKILNFNIFWGFQKNKYFFGVWRFYGYFVGVIIKLDYISGLFLCILRSFLNVIVMNGDIFLGVAKISNIVWVLEIPDIFLGWRVDAGPEPTYVEKLRVPPPPLSTVVCIITVGVRFESLSGHIQ